jgi:hypothetical protein
MAPRVDWAYELAKNNRYPTTQADFEDFAMQMDAIELKGAYNPKNVYPGSPFMPSSEHTPAEVRQQAKYGSQRVLEHWDTLRKIVERHAETLEKRWMKKTRYEYRGVLFPYAGELQGSSSNADSPTAPGLFICTS